MHKLIEIMENKLLKEEIWKDLTGWEGLYQVSNKMRMRIIGRVVKGNKFKIPNPILLKRVTTKYSYNECIYFKLSIGGQQKPLPAIHYYRATFKGSSYNYKDFNDVFVNYETRKSVLRTRIDEMTSQLGKLPIDESIELLKKINALGHKLRFERQGKVKTFCDSYRFVDVGI